MIRYWLTLLFFWTGIVVALPVKDIPINLAVVDLAGVMTTQQKNTLESQLRQINQRGDMQAAVVIVPTTDGVDLFDYGMSLVDRWQLGDAKKDNGLLLLIATQDRKLRFFQGYGLEGDLPDIALKGVIDDTITPLFKKGQYAEGISTGMEHIAKALNGEGLPLPRSPTPSNGQGDDDIGAGILPFLLFFLFGWARGLSRRIGKLQTWLVLSGVGSGILLFMFGITVQALVFIIILSIILLPISFIASSVPLAAHSSSGRLHDRDGFGGSSSSGGWSSYDGGGGGFGGGGAGGSW